MVRDEIAFRSRMRHGRPHRIGPPGLIDVPMAGIIHMDEIGEHETVFEDHARASLANHAQAYHATKGSISEASSSLPGRFTRFETGQERSMPAGTGCSSSAPAAPLSQVSKLSGASSTGMRS